MFFKNVGQSAATYSYSIYKPTAGVNTLVIFNGFSSVSGYPQDYYFGMESDFFPFDHDSWAYGPLPADAANSYKNIIEITNSDGGPADYNNDVISTWLAASPDHNYMVAGQEFLGAGYSYTDMDFAAGTFEYDILGVTHSYNDVSYDGTSGQELPTLVTPMQGSLLCDSLYMLFNSMPPSDSLLYAPNFELGVNNWVDGGK